MTFLFPSQHSYSPVTPHLYQEWAQNLSPVSNSACNPRWQGFRSGEGKLGQKVRYSASPHPHDWRTSQIMVSWSKSSGEVSRSENTVTFPANLLSWILRFPPLPSKFLDPSTLPLNPYRNLWRSFHFTDASSMAQETLYLTGDSASSGPPCPSCCQPLLVHTLPSLTLSTTWSFSDIHLSYLTRTLVHWCYYFRKPNPSLSSMAHLRVHGQKRV